MIFCLANLEVMHDDEYHHEPRKFDDEYFIT